MSAVMPFEESLPVPQLSDEASKYYETIDLSFNQEDSRRREETRYLWTPLDVIEEARKRDFGELLRSGGTEINSPCLWRYSPKKYLKRGRIQPLEVGPEYHMPDEVSEADKRAALRVVPNAKGRPASYGLGVYPGEQIRRILQPDHATGLPHGVVEITSLAGRVFTRSKEAGGDDAGLVALSRFFFPAGLEALPLTLRELQQLVQVAGDKLTANKLSDEERRLLQPFKFSEVETMATEKLRACGQARAWGTFVVSRANQLVQKSTAKFVYSYQDIERLLMKQLEIKPVTTAQADDGEAARVFASGLRQAVENMAPTAQTPRVTLDDLRQLAAEHPEEVRAILGRKTGPKAKAAEEAE
jgi:hypothetical protein